MDIKQVEEMLSGYEDEKKRKSILEIDLNCIEETGVSAIDYKTEKTSETYKITRPTEDSGITNIQNKEKNDRIKEQIREEIKILESRIQIIDKAISRLDEEERQVVIKYYFENKTYEVISKETYLSEKQIRHRKKGALNKIKKLLEKGRKRAV